MAKQKSVVEQLWEIRPLKPSPEELARWAAMEPELVISFRPGPASSRPGQRLKTKGRAPSSKLLDLLTRDDGPNASDD